MNEEENRAHSAFLTHVIYRFRAIERIVVSLKQKPKHGWVPAAAFMLVVVLAFGGIGIYLDGYVIHPPQQFTGICPPPNDVIRGDGCYSEQVVTVTQGTVTKVSTIYVPAGHVLNGTGG